MIRTASLLFATMAFIGGLEAAAGAPDRLMWFWLITAVAAIALAVLSVASKR